MHKIESHLSLLTWFLPILICNLSQPSSETNYSQSYYTIIIKVVTLLLVCHCTDANWRRLFHYVDSLSEDWPSFELCFEISLGDQIEPVMVNLSKDHECVGVGPVGIHPHKATEVNTPQADKNRNFTHFVTGSLA